MPVTISGTSGVQLPLGSASAPSATNTTAQTTGVYYPTSTTLGLSTNGTAALTIDASQQVGIGTSSPLTKLHVNGSITLQSGNIVGPSNNNAFTISADSSATSGGYIQLYSSAYASPNLILFGTSNSERMRIDSSGNLLVGTTNAASQKFKVQAATDICLGFASSTVVASSFTLNATNDASSVNIPLDFRASAIYASAGIGTTASAANAFFNNAASNQFLRSTSALKYKTNIRDLESIDINKFRPVRYNSLCEADDPHKEHFGIIADEVANSGITELVTYGENGDVEGFQYERLTVVLVKAIQELSAKVDAQAAEIAALKAKVPA